MPHFEKQRRGWAGRSFVYHDLSSRRVTFNCVPVHPMKLFVHNLDAINKDYRTNDHSRKNPRWFKAPV